MSGEPRVFRGFELPRGSVERLGKRGGEIQLAGLEHGGGPYEVRIFLNNAVADSRTERTADAGYAGTIHVYGAGRPADATPQPVDRALDVTSALRRAGRAGSELTVTLVPVADSEPAVGRTVEDVTVSLQVHE